MRLFTLFILIASLLSVVLNAACDSTQLNTGYYTSGSSCTFCGSGKYSTGTGCGDCNPVNNCYACYENNASKCSTCDTNYYLSSSNSCEACPTGQVIVASNNASSCWACSSTCYTCTAITTTAACTSCIANTYLSYK